MPAGHGSHEPWTRREDTILCRFYDKGVDEVAPLLPDRTVEAIRQRAVKLGAAAPRAAGLRVPCADQDMDVIMALRDQGMGYRAIARLLDLKEQAVSNAVLRVECERAGFTPARRDAAGGLIAQDAERLYGFIREGLTGVEIQRRLGVSASCVLHYRARLKRNGEQLPPPGNGMRYSGSRVQKDVRKEVDRLFMLGYGAAKVAELAGVTVTFAKRRRLMLVHQLAARGECLPGCDLNGRRVQVKESAAWITEQQRVDLQWLLMEGWPIAPAAQELRIGKSSAYRIANELKARLAAEGRNLPRPVAANLREVPRHLKSWKLAHAGNNDVATATKPATAAEGPSQTPTRAEAPPPVEM